MSKIDSHSKTVRELLHGVKYAIDYYQREYKWQEENISELLEDLETKFMQSYDDRHERKEGANYEHYFLGSIIISEKSGDRYIIDGQQRLTSLTLLLIYLNHLQQGRQGSIPDLSSLIRSTERGESTYNLNVDDRVEVMDALFNDQEYDAVGKPESIRNIVARYEDIERHFPESLRDRPLLFFIDWLLHNVDLVEIKAYSDDDAYMIFETMNDRGISLTPTEMLKGYLLSNIPGDADRQRATALWRERMEILVPPGRDSKDEDANFFKAWLRARYAVTIRSREKNAIPEDYDKIGTAFNKWVYDKSGHIGLETPSDFRNFVEKLFPTFSDHYLRIRQAAYTFTPGFEYVYYNRYCGFTLQSPLILAPIRPEDSQETIDKKIRLVSGYLDIYIARHIWNFRNYDYNRIYYGMFQLILAIRDRDVRELATILRERLEAMKDPVFGASDFGRNKMNSWRIRYMLARITYHIEQRSGVPSTFTQYIDNKIKKPFEIEHIWADKFERHKDEFTHPHDFREYRNRLGGLILSQRGVNQSFRDAPYEKKVDHYYKENLLASSLSEKCYQHNPSFLAYVHESGLPFQPYAHFTKASIDERQELYRRIAEEIWSPERLVRELQ